MSIESLALTRDRNGVHTRTRTRRPASFDDHPEVVTTRHRLEFRSHIERLGLPNPYLEPHEGVNATTVQKYGRELVNFSSYNYLGLSGHPHVSEAAKAAIDTYGTSVSASRVVSGEISLYAQLERRIACAYDVEESIATTSGYLTNAAVIGYLLGPRDIAFCDSLVHNSLVSGTQWAGCRRVNFRHNDPTSLEAVLKMSRSSAERAMVVLEGHYSMEGDTALLPELIAVARKYDCVIMIDEAHSFGVLGGRGFGMREVYGLAGDAVDIWMGTLSKALGSCGGFLAGKRDLVMAFKYSAPGLSMFTGGPAPSAIAAALAALEVLEAEPERVQRLQENGRHLWKLFIDRGFETGVAQGTPIVPVIMGEIGRAALASVKLIQAGINVNAILAPAVPQGEERLRFFATSEHTTDQLETAVEELDKVVRTT
ncbi:aminotransferase class I/II-fold pyridoxal phosphate-dependent enzyme [Mycobacterium sp. Aquia_213]|uniref:aminotransferase class I/II-fold pyridoxal phosphate-dependent enzyme n=1 Tax=Mycobacterium sp. Aquia_213 TaxID=2991728 RepID=UPI0022707EE7|nr:aminotransferase class I/II-fold pyridoxal phosphate-dependent enzyme [Mycobacterium sp. Aquia_213]WAC90179.1 aminotransferase class I/II-fold pyridoxal phosphate-dependent enzyme [Mycobacterium sp. Aquia_213]